MQKIQESGLKLNISKCVFKATEIKFLGHIVSANGIKPDPEKIHTINNMPIPSSKKELQRFIGMVNYLGKFSFQISLMYWNHYIGYLRKILNL